MKTKSPPPGKDISRADVVHISQHGFWLLIDGVEYFLPFDKFPWFKAASPSQTRNVELLRAGHLYWPDLDIDLSLDIIAEPDKYPLVAR